MFIVLNYILHHLVFNFRFSKELALQELAREEVRLEAQQSCDFRIQRLETVENWYFRVLFWGSILQLLFSMHFWRWWTDSDFNGKNLKSRWPGKTRNSARWEAGRLAQSVWRRCAQVYQVDIPWWRLFWSWFPERLKAWNSLNLSKVILLFENNLVLFSPSFIHVAFDLQSDTDVVDRDKPGRCTSAGIHKLGWP